MISENQRSWICPKCSAELGEYNGYCEYCYQDNKIKIYNPSPYFIREIRIYHLSQGDTPVTPQEELFKELYNGTKVLVMNMSPLERREFAEKLEEIAFKGKVSKQVLYDIENEEKKSKSPKSQGFERNINVDETTTNSINTIKERQKKLSGKEKMIDNLKKLYMKGGMTEIEAEKTAILATTAGAVLNRVKDQPSKDIILDVREKVTDNTTFNPFAKKE